MKYIMVLFRLGTTRCYESNDGRVRGRHLQWEKFRELKKANKLVFERKDEIETEEIWRVKQ